MDRVRELVAAGDVSVVLAQDRDRFSREPAYTYLLKREFKEHGCELRSLNDRGDGSLEWELTDGILDQLAKYERAKFAERSRRGKLRKAREGKVIAIHTPNYGFRYNDRRDGYEVDEENMQVVRRIFRMMGAEHSTLLGTKRSLERECVPAPNDGRAWHRKGLRGYILDDVYKPHTHAEIMALVDSGHLAASVAARLDPNRSYGLWWFNRRRTTRTQVAEAGVGGERTYKRQSRYVYRPKEDWVAVPVPDSGIPREWVEAAREAMTENRLPSAASRRVWELSGSIIKCGVCGYNLMSHYVTAPRAKNRLFYYTCRKHNREGNDACPHRKHHRAESVEARVWDLVSSLLKDPERLRAGLEAMIEAERAGMRGDPDQEVKVWLAKLSEVDQERRGYLRLAATGRITDEELDDTLAAIEHTRQAAKKELITLRGRQERVERLEDDKEKLMRSYAAMTPDALDALDPEDRHHNYKILKLRVAVYPDGALDISGALAERFSHENQDQGIHPQDRRAHGERFHTRREGRSALAPSGMPRV